MDFRDFLIKFINQTQNALNKCKAWKFYPFSHLLNYIHHQGSSC